VRKHHVSFRRLYKFQTNEDSVFQTRVIGYEAEVEGGWVRLEEDGRIFFKAGYSWNGCSLVPDLPGTEMPSQVHDGIYQLVQEGRIPKKHNRKLGDLTFRDMMKDNDVIHPIRWLFYLGVRVGGWAFC